MTLEFARLRFAVCVLVLASAARAAAEPCTLYKPQNVAIAKANIERHAWANSILGGYGGCFADMDQAEVAKEMGRHAPAGKFPPGVICHPARRMRERSKDGSVRLSGRFGFATLDSAGRLQHALLLDGTELACGGQTLKARLPRASFEITKAEGRTVELAQPLSAELAQPGGYVRSGQTAFAIDKVAGRRVTFRDFPFEGGKEIVAPSAVWLAAERQCVDQ